MTGVRRIALAAAVLGAATAAWGCGSGGPFGTMAGEPPVPQDSLAGSAPARYGSPPVGLEVVERLEFAPLEFEPPSPDRFELSNGVTVFHLRDATLPVVNLFITFKGGYSYFDREQFGAATALLPLMRNGGTRYLTPDSLDALIEFNALGLSTSTDGGRMMLGVSMLRRQLELAVGVWSDILLHPRFDPDATELWRVRELEAARRLGDFPGSLAVLEFNRLMYADHPTGWMMTQADLLPERVDSARLAWLHRRIVCPGTAVIGAAGDVSQDELKAVLEQTLGSWQPCDAPLEPPPLPDLRRSPGVYLIPKELSQSTVVIGQPGGVLLEESTDYFASRIANWVIGGSGFTSRLMARLRTEEGLAYTAASIWGAARNHERIFGAITHTRAEKTVEAAQMVIDVLGGATTDPPDREHVELARESIVNGFVFGFGSPAQVVARQVSYLAAGFPADWLARYLRGIRDVSTSDVARVLRRRIDPDGFTILIVGDTTQFDASRLGPVTVLPPR